MHRTILIGDPHGCWEELEELLVACGATPKDHVIILGDLLDRGPDSARCVDIAMRVGDQQGKPACVLGNHEETHIRYEDTYVREGRLKHPLSPNHARTRAQLTQRHYAYLRSLPLFIRIPEHNAVAVHAGVFPGRAIERQSPRHLLHGQMLKPFDFDERGDMRVNEKTCWPTRVPQGEDGWKFWTHYWDGPERIIFGHSVLTEPLITDKAVGIDGGCCFGLELWAFIMPGDELVRVKSKQSGDGNRDRGITLVHGNVGTY